MDYREEERQTKVVSNISWPDSVILLRQQQPGQVIYSQLNIRVQKETWD